MESNQPIAVSLEEFGLSKYETNAYVTLISKGTISASELAYHSGLPRTKIYPTLLKLEKKNLVTISKNKPIICTAIAPEDAFNELIQEQIHKVNSMNTLVTKLKEKSDEGKKLMGKEERRYFLLFPNYVLDIIKNHIISSNNSIKMTLDRWSLRLLAECREEIISAIRKDVEIKIIVEPSQVGSESFRKIPEGIEIRMSDVNQNCFIFDNNDVLLIDSKNGKGAIFSSTEILGASQTKMFVQNWKKSLRTDCFSNMNKNQIQEVSKVIELVNENGIGYILNNSINGEKNKSLAGFVQNNGIDLNAKSITEIQELIGSAIEITCFGELDIDERNNNITINSKLNSGHALPWASILDGYLQEKGYKTKLIYQPNSKGEKILIKISE